MGSADLLFTQYLYYPSSSSGFPTPFGGAGPHPTLEARVAPYINLMLRGGGCEAVQSLQDKT